MFGIKYLSQTLIMKYSLRSGSYISTLWAIYTYFPKDKLQRGILQHAIEGGNNLLIRKLLLDPRVKQQEPKTCHEFKRLIPALLEFVIPTDNILVFLYLMQLIAKITQTDVIVQAKIYITKACSHGAVKIAQWILTRTTMIIEKDVLKIVIMGYHLLILELLWVYTNISQDKYTLQTVISEANNSRLYLWYNNKFGTVRTELITFRDKSV